MTIDVAPRPQVRRLIGDLAHEFGGTVPVADIRAEVLAAVADLDGQIVPDALEEMAHRLVRFRLETRLDDDATADEERTRAT